MDVRNLSQDQLSELKSTYFWGARDYLAENPNDEQAIARDEAVDRYGYPDAIPDELIFDFYAGIYFVSDDFCCTASENF